MGRIRRTTPGFLLFRGLVFLGVRLILSTHPTSSVVVTFSPHSPLVGPTTSLTHPLCETQKGTGALTTQIGMAQPSTQFNSD
jgi:hypothetical protein